MALDEAALHVPLVCAAPGGCCCGDGEDERWLTSPLNMGLSITLVMTFGIWEAATPDMAEECRGGSGEREGARKLRPVYCNVGRLENLLGGFARCCALVPRKTIPWQMIQQQVRVRDGGVGNGGQN